MLEGKGRGKNKRLVFDRRTQHENIRRILLASAGFLVFFFASALIMEVQTAYPVKSWVIWSSFALAEAYAAGYFCYSYCWLQKKRKEKAKAAVYLFWGMFELLFLIYSVATQNIFLALADCWIISVVMAVIPLWNKREFLVFQAVQITAIVILIYSHELKPEIIIYLGANQLLCGIISRQGYRNFRQRAADATAIDTAKALSETDAMTGLLNRRGLERVLQNMWSLCMQNREKIAVVMIDIDNFKKYNDYFGHMKGDHCIRQVTREIHQAVQRKTDFAARVGGEEFVVCLVGIEREEALKWTAELKQKIENLKIPQAEDNFLPVVSISMGIAWIRGKGGVCFEQMQQQADQFLYEAKAKGRACICMDGTCYEQVKVKRNLRQYHMEQGFRSMNHGLDNEKKLS